MWGLLSTREPVAWGRSPHTTGSVKKPVHYDRRSSGGYTPEAVTAYRPLTPTTAPRGYWPTVNDSMPRWHYNCKVILIRQSVATSPLCYPTAHGGLRSQLQPGRA